jgi:competence ComEA-like helix-hairpin-helix protein
MNFLRTHASRIRLKRVFLALALLLLTLPVLGARQPADTRININTASPEELMRLPGIGQTRAYRIVEYRRKHGGFKRPQEIIIVQGMSARRYRLIAHLIRI